MVPSDDEDERDMPINPLVRLALHHPPSLYCPNPALGDLKWQPDLEATCRLVCPASITQAPDLRPG